MSFHPRRVLLLITLLLCALLVAFPIAGCRSRPPAKPQPQVAIVAMGASATANPGPDGRPSPIVLRLYQLKAAAAFLNCDYFPLIDDEQKILGGDLVSREEQELFPGQTVSFEIPFAAETRFIGVTGGYRDTGSASWRAIAPVRGRKGPSVHVMVLADRSALAVSVTP